MKIALESLETLRSGQVPYSLSPVGGPIHEPFIAMSIWVKRF